jgi:hypothetical protein
VALSRHFVSLPLDRTAPQISGKSQRKERDSRSLPTLAQGFERCKGADVFGGEKQGLEEMELFV